MLPSTLVRHFDDDVREFMDDNSGDYVVSQSKRGHLEKSVMKLDIDPVYKFRQHPKIVDALQFVGDMFDDAFRQDHMDMQTLIDEVVGDTSSGIIEALRGLPKKWMCMREELPILEYENPDLTEVPIWKVSGKVEIKKRADYIGEMKQRTFIIEPFGHLWQTKKFYGNQNKALKMSGWSYYGFDPYAGGVNTLANSLLRHRRFWELDGRGWDRSIPMMQEIYDLRNVYRKDSALLRWVYQHLIESILQFPNGDVVLKKWGNNSGSGNTTGDNTLGMCLVLALVFFHLGCTAKDIVDKVSIAVFGDDVVGADSLDVSDEELERGFRHIFTDMFGIVLDPFVIYSRVTELHFLGFQIAEYKGMYIPKYPVDRLCASVLGNQKGMEVRAELNKLASLMLMSAGNGRDVYSFFRRALMDAIYKSDHESAVELRKQNLDIVIPTYEVTIDWYCGFEGPGISSMEPWFDLFA